MNTREMNLPVDDYDLLQILIALMLLQNELLWDGKQTKGVDDLISRLLECMEKRQKDLYDQ